MNSIFNSNQMFLFNCSREYESDANTSDEEKNRLRTAEICKDLHRIINKSLHSVAPHLMDSEVDIESRHEAFWMVGGNSNTF